MSSRVAHYLQEHLVGEVIDNTDARRHFATDGSILQAAPSLIIYPKNENDVRKAARFSWQLAERGRVIPLISRGNGTDKTGAAIGTGIIVSFTAHMNRILQLDTRAHNVTVEPGINYGRLQEVLHTHGRFLPPYPASLDYSTIGGAVANNKTGQKSVKYGDTLRYVRNLRMVLANGEVIETGRISKRDLSKKLGLATFEGEVYRSVDTLLEEHSDLLAGIDRDTVVNNAGYNLVDVKEKDGSFDLTPLIVGSQGTLGIITEVTLGSEPFDPRTILIVAQFDSIKFLQEAIIELRAMSEKPSALEIVDKNVLDQMQKLNPNYLTEAIAEPYPPLVLLVEFEGDDKTARKPMRTATKILAKYSQKVDEITDPEKQIVAWKIRESINVINSHNDGLIRSLPLFDGAVPIDRLKDYLDGVYEILGIAKQGATIWGHAGDGNIYVQPRFNLGHIGDRQRIFKLIDEYNKLVIGLNGTISASSSDGRLKAPYLEAMYGSNVYSLLYKVKQIFDPYNTLNPGVKFGTSPDDLKALVRQDFGLDHLYNHLPRS